MIVYVEQYFRACIEIDEASTEEEARAFVEDMNNDARMEEVFDSCDLIDGGYRIIPKEDR